MNYFQFGDKTSLDFGLRIEKNPILTSPERRMKEITVPGRSGRLHYDQGGFDSITKTYECGIFDRDGVHYTAYPVKRWLYSPGKKRLCDSYDPEHYRMAVFIGPVDIESKLQKFGHCKIKFRCDPRAYLENGNDIITLSGNATVENPYFGSAPMIRVYGDGAGVLEISGCAVEITDIGGCTTLDCDNMDAFRGIENRNGFVIADRFPSLEPGENAITISGGIEKIEIEPRWWEL